MEIFAFVVVALALGIVASIVLGNPMWILVALIVGALAANRAGYRQQGRAVRSAFDDRPSPAPASRGTDAAAQLEGLASMRDRGLITGEEYDAKKAEILGRI